jgi:hypothetical protein
MVWQQKGDFISSETYASEPSNPILFMERNLKETV